MSEMPLTPQEMQEGERAILIQAQHMEPLVRSDGYIALRKLAEAQILSHMQAWSTGGGSRDEDMFRKGAINGIRAIINTPDQILDHRKAILESMLKPMSPSEDDPPKTMVDTGESVMEASSVVESPEDTEGTYQSVEEAKPHGE